MILTKNKNNISMFLEITIKRRILKNNQLIQKYNQIDPKQLKNNHNNYTM